MSLFVIKFITNRLIKDNQWNKFAVEDPYYEYFPIARDSKGNTTKTKRVKRRVPDGISPNDYKILNKVRKKAYRYDMSFNFLGIKVGWTNIVGLIPAFGSIIAIYWSLSIFSLARKIDDGLPLDLQLLFLINILIDFALSLIPIVGDIIEIGYKANLRNFLLLNKHLIKVGEKNLGLIDESEVRPNFINDKVSPFVDDKVKPGAIKAGESVQNFVNKHLHSGSSTPSSNSASSFASRSPTLQTSSTTVTTSSQPYHENVHLPKKLKASYDDDATVVDNKSIRSLGSFARKDSFSQMDSDKSSLHHHHLT